MGYMGHFCPIACDWRYFSYFSVYLVAYMSVPLRYNHRTDHSLKKDEGDSREGGTCHLDVILVFYTHVQEVLKHTLFKEMTEMDDW